MAYKSCCGGGGSVTINGAEDIEIQVLCDVNGAVSTPFIRFYKTDPDTNVTTVISNLDFSGANYVPTGTVGLCSSDDFEVTSEVLCDNNAGVYTTFIRYTYVDETGTISQQVDLDLAGAAYVVTGVVGACPSFDVEQTRLCDDTLNDGTTIVEFVRHTTYDRDGTVSITVDTELDMTTVYAVLGTVESCERQIDNAQFFSETLSGIQVFVAPANLKSFSYFVAQIGDSDTLPQLTTNSPARDIYIGESGNFEVDNGELLGTMQIEMFHADDIVIINYMTR